MPTPEGAINTSQFWSGDNGNSEQAVEETAQDNTATEEATVAESALVEDNSN